jgi:hypothetical protein
MLDNFFIEYANHPFKGNPANIKKILHIISKEIENQTVLQNQRLATLVGVTKLKQIASGIEKFSQLPQIQNYLHAMTQPQGDKLHEDNLLSVVLSATDAPKKICTEECLYSGKTPVPDKTSCLICHQECFWTLLKEFSDGIPLEEIGAWGKLKTGDTLLPSTPDPFNSVLYKFTLQKYFGHAFDYFKTNVEPTEDGIRQYDFLSLEGLVSERSDYLPATRIDDFITSIVGYSLVKFLENNSPKQIKLCPMCAEFYTAKTKRVKKYCSNKCRLDYHNNKPGSRERMREFKKRRKLDIDCPESYF